jgi:hypothetical protein
MEVTVLRLYDMIINYCKTNNVSVIYYEVKYRNEAEKASILNFYEGKVPFEVHESLKVEDDNFIVFNKAETAIEYAESAFPYYPELKETAPLYYIFVCVFDNDGNFLWENGA